MQCNDCVQGSQLNFGDTDANFTGIGASVFLLVTLLMFTLVTLLGHLVPTLLEVMIDTRFKDPLYL